MKMSIAIPLTMLTTMARAPMESCPTLAVLETKESFLGTSTQGSKCTMEL